MAVSDPLIVTLISPAGLSQAHVATASEALNALGGIVSAEVAFDPPHATDLIVRGAAAAEARGVLEAMLPDVDVVVQPGTGPRRKRLLLADMDSTMIRQECIDELADFAGLKAEIAAITERAMQGELDFAQALEARVAALAGLDADAIRLCLEERIELMPGARTLIATMKALGARTVLVSGGFTAFTGPIAGWIGFDRNEANLLHVEAGRLSGTVGKPIVDSAVKRATLLAERDTLGLSATETLAVGDGANDIPMLEAAGLGIAYHAKPKAAAAADAAVRVGDLTTLLWAQGLPRADWVDAQDGIGAA
ncbi:phosphoserine phosphatase SerB [Sandaracinobacter sp. RS1-74]|uniref:phosphoserine phosphatase SerB n=1 Tax=Sandaracinobacteroides sayramensis TaxID=2913411 RepID=UPI001EDC5A41|nr:phosphoserine phosphatase SerB [Sandaracinobacteroides sayramensis]MCG2839399.1 phosphoserine phosphatase SerB [Sandaracinobacteroides sayramensis]